MENHFKENLDYLTHEEKFNCNVAELAKKLNITRQSIRYYTIGKAKPSFDNLIKICEIYDITPTQLITWNLQESFKNH
jgi:transcriptional regulator with XRE-family HTH domain